MPSPRNNQRKAWSTRKPELFPQLAMKAIKDYIEKRDRVYTDPVKAYGAWMQKQAKRRRLERLNAKVKQEKERAENTQP